MKSLKSIKVATCVAVFIFSMSSFGEQITINMLEAVQNSSAKYTGNLEHAYAYYWSVNINSYLNGAELESASLRITGLNNIPEPDYTDSLYLTLMDVKAPSNQTNSNQLNLYTDNGGWNNFFDKAIMGTGTSTNSPYDNYTAYSNVATYTDNNAVIKYYPNYSVANDPENKTWALNVNTINSYIGGTSNGFLGIGLDADCHYTGNVSLILNTNSTSVPEPTMLSLLGCGLISIVFFRRKR